MKPFDGQSQLVLGSLAGHPEISRLIGEFVVRWSLAEAALVLPMLVAMNTQSQEVAWAILASTNSTEGKIKLVKNAVASMRQAQHQHLKKPIGESLKKLEKICEQRNNISHHLWAVNSETSQVITIDYRKQVNAGRFSERSESDLRKMCNDALDAAVAICAATGSPWITAEAIKQYRM